MYMKLSQDLILPEDASTQKLAFLGVSGSGKTYGAGKFVEELLKADEQVVVIDTIGNWWGLRLAADGKTPSKFTLPILGGVRGDVELVPTAGEIVADTVAGTRESLIIDVSDFTKGELHRFVTAFATRLLKAKKAAPSPTMIIWEECQSVIPQVVRGETARMVGAVEDLVKKGRNYGVGTTLISQRPQAVNKDVLNQCETLFVFRMGAPHERKAINEWVVDKAIDVKDFLGDLSTLKKGDCFVWSPAWLECLKRIHVGQKTTFDASETPKFKGRAKKVHLPKIDLSALEQTMKDAIEQTKANDPTELKKKVKELEAQVSKQHKELVCALDAVNQVKAAKPAKVVEIPFPVLNEKTILSVEKLVDKLSVHGTDVIAAANELSDKLKRSVEAYQVAKAERKSEMAQMFNNTIGATHGGGVYASSVKARLAQDLDTTFPEMKKYQQKHSSIGSPAHLAVLRDAKTVVDGELSKCAREILAVVVRYSNASNMGYCGRTHAAILAGYSPHSSGIPNAISELYVGGYIDKVNTEDGALIATTKGKSVFPNGPGPHPTPTELLHTWMQKLGGREADMLRMLVNYPNGLERDKLAIGVNLSPTSSGVPNYISALNVRKLIRKEGNVIKAAPEFLP